MFLNYNYLFIYYFITFIFDYYILAFFSIIFWVLHILRVRILRVRILRLRILWVRILRVRILGLRILRVRTPHSAVRSPHSALRVFMTAKWYVLWTLIRNQLHFLSVYFWTFTINWHYIFLQFYSGFLNKNKFRETVKTILLEQDPPYHKKGGGLFLYPSSPTSRDGVLFV